MDVQEDLSLEGFSSSPSSGRSLILTVMRCSRLQGSDLIASSGLNFSKSWPSHCCVSTLSTLSLRSASQRLAARAGAACRVLVSLCPWCPPTGAAAESWLLVCNAQSSPFCAPGGWGGPWSTAEGGIKLDPCSAWLQEVAARGHVHPDGSIPLARVGAGMQHRGMTYWEGNVPLLWWLDWVQLGLKCVLKYFLIRVSLWEVADGRAGLN